MVCPQKWPFSEVGNFNFSPYKSIYKHTDTEESLWDRSFPSKQPEAMVDMLHFLHLAVVEAGFIMAAGAIVFAVMHVY